MKKILVLLLITASVARGEFLQMNLSIFGMD